jgi:hypothetical protein
MDVVCIHRFYLYKIAQRFAIARIEENALAKRRKSFFWLLANPAKEWLALVYDEGCTLRVETQQHKRQRVL